MIGMGLRSNNSRLGHWQQSRRRIALHVFFLPILAGVILRSAQLGQEYAAEKINFRTVSVPVEVKVRLRVGKHKALLSA